VICDVCGRNNADNLTFCQDCGRRLRQQRGVAPTPPNGMPKFQPVAHAAEPAPDSGRGSSPSGPPSPGRRSRPAAPAFTFAPAAPVAAEPEPPRPPSPPSVTLCVECSSPNPPAYRFCVTCGTSLQHASPEAAAPRPAPLPPRPAPPAVPPAPSASTPFEGERIVGAPVLDIAASGTTPASVVTCGRCHAHCVAGTRFCKYCGASLDEPPRNPGERSGERPARAPEPEPLPSAAWHSTVTEPRRPFEVGKVPLAPIGRGPDSDPSSSGAGLRPAVIPPTPAPVPVQEAHPYGASPRLAAAPIPLTPTVQSVPSPAAEASPPRPVPLVGAPNPPAPRPIPSVPQTPPSPRIEDARPFDAGVRSEISALAGSPVPAEPLIPSPPPPREAHREAPREPRERDAAPEGSSAHDARPRPRGAVEPAAPRPAHSRSNGGRLVVIVEDGSEGRSFSMAEGQLDVGRTDGDIVLEDDPYVSPRHARLRRADGGAWFLRDLDSTNHVYVRLRKPHAMRDGDLLLLGLEVLQFQTVSDGERGLGHAIQHGTFVFGSPATPRRARLCQRTVEGVIRDVYHLFRDETIIGREVGDIVFTADPFLSRRHASILRNPVTSEFALVDLDSSNGTYVAIRGEIAISDGDFLRIGQHLFRVDLG